MDVPEPGAALDFCKTLWEIPTVHNGAANWLRSIEAGLCFLTRQSYLCITLLHVLEVILYICLGVCNT